MFVITGPMGSGGVIEIAVLVSRRARGLDSVGARGGISSPSVSVGVTSISSSSDSSTTLSSV